MKRSVAALLLVIAGVVFLAILVIPKIIPPTEDRNMRWERFDVLINNIDTARNYFQVTETYRLTVETGPFHYGTATIPLGRVTDINGVKVSVNGTPVTYYQDRTKDNLSIKYYFPTTVYSGDRLNISFSYGVYGALRSYKAGDQIYWVAVPADHQYVVQNSQVTVVLPDNAPPIKMTSYPDTWKMNQQGNTITWTSPGKIKVGDNVEVRVQYPHDPRMKKPGWQASYDREQNYIDNTQPLVSLIIIAASILAGLGGLLWILISYFTQGRDPEVIAVPEYLTEPPSDELPGIIGTLVDERADMQDLMATLVDLAQKGYLTIEQTSGGGLLEGSDFSFHRSELPADGLALHEHRLLKGLFPLDAQNNTMSGLREKFYAHIPGIKKGMYEEVVRRGYFPRSPELTRNTWTIMSIAGLVIAAVLFYVATQTPTGKLISPFAFFPGLALAVVSGIGLLVSGDMPVKTQKGAQEAARWKAFRHYLDNIDKYGDIEAAAQRFDKFMPYAIAFGLQNEMLKKVLPAMKEMPSWYFPTYLGGPWQGGYMRGGLPNRHAQPMMGGPSFGNMGKGVDLGGLGDLNAMHRSLTEGLNAMNSGMTRMLNDASHAMTSRPQSSGSGRRGGGWSGGGFHGGGGSGGGSRGFG